MGKKSSVTSRSFSFVNYQKFVHTQAYFIYIKIITPYIIAQNMFPNVQDVIYTIYSSLNTTINHKLDHTICK